MRRLWELIGFAVRFEVNLYRALGRWVARRPDVPEGATAWGYAQMVTPVLWLWIFGSAVEVVAVHLITPWPTIRLILLIIGLWGLLWMVGLLASYRVYPHLQRATGLTIRHAKRASIDVGWAQIESATTVDRDLESPLATYQPLTTESGVDLQIGVSGRANVQLRLSEPITVTVKGEPVSATALTCWVDDPKAFVAMARRG